MISNKTLRNQRSSLTDKKKLYSTLMKNKKFRFKRSRNIEPKSFLNIKSSDNNDIENNKKNYDLVEEFLDKMDEERIRKYNEIEKNFMKHLSYENILYITKQNDNNSIDKKKENLKLKESDFIKFKRKQMIKEKKYLKQKSRIFDNTFYLGYNLNNLKNKPIPHFLKLKFNMKTTKKFGEIIGSYFGLPV